MLDKTCTQISPAQSAFQEAVQVSSVTNKSTDCEAKKVRCVSTWRSTGTISVRLAPRPPKSETDSSTH